jgi:hypothetical protein
MPELNVNGKAANERELRYESNEIGDQIAATFNSGYMDGSSSLSAEIQCKPEILHWSTVSLGLFQSDPHYLTNEHMTGRSRWDVGLGSLPANLLRRYLCVSQRLWFFAIILILNER